METSGSTIFSIIIIILHVNHKKHTRLFHRLRFPHVKMHDSYTSKVISLIQRNRYYLGYTI